MHALGLEFGSAAQLSKRPGSVWNCLWGNALKRSPGIIRKSRVSYPGPGFLSSATWPSLPKKHYNGLKSISYCYGYIILLINICFNVCKMSSIDKSFDSVVYNVGSSCGRADSVIDSHTTGAGFKTRLVRYFLPSFRLTTTITASLS